MKKLILLFVSIIICSFLFAQKQKGDRKKRKSIDITAIEKQVEGYSFDKKTNRVTNSEFTVANGTKYIVEHSYDSVIDMNDNNYKVKVWKLVKTYPNTWRKQKIGETFRPQKQANRSTQPMTNVEYVLSALTKPIN